jgi:DhnA family fructose-bisphosphate aldolase class Ia
VHPQSGHALLVSATAAMEIGVPPNLVHLPDIIAALAADGCLTGIILHAGVLKSVFRRCPDLPCGTIVDLMSGTWLAPRPDRREQIASLHQALRAGADAVLATIALGCADEARQLRLCGEIARDCTAWGLPLLLRIDTLETDAQRQFSPALCGHGARLAWELGADLAIVNHVQPRTAFREALRGVDIPVLIGGGPSFHTNAAVLESVIHAVADGARGVVLNGAMCGGQGTPLLSRLADVLSLGTE